MIRTRLFVALALASLALPAVHAARQAKDTGAAVALQAAIKIETIDGDLKAAIDAYRKVVATYRTRDQASAARALLRMGECYEKLGDTEARKAYEQLLRDFADQKSVADQARARLAALTPGGARSGREPASRMVWEVPTGSWAGRVSADGHLVAVFEVDDVGYRYVVRDLASGTERAVHSPDFVDTTYMMSRDGKQYVHDWHDKKANQRGVSFGTFSSSESPAERRIVLDWEYVEPLDWSPDGKSIVAMAYAGRSQTALLISPQDGAVRTLKANMPSARIGRAAFSPDGRFLAFEMTGSDTPAQDILVLRTADGSEAASMRHPADEGLVGWSPDGSRLIFTSDRQGSSGLWAQRFVDGTLQGSPDLLKADVGDFSPIGVAASGAVYYTVDNNWVRPDLKIGSFDFSEGRWIVPPADGVRERVRGIRPAANPSPTWSPDGKTFAYLMGGGSNQFMTDSRIVVRPADARAGSIVDPNLSVLVAPIQWSPDGTALAAAGRAPDDTWAIWRIDARTGARSPLALGASVIYARKWSKDGTRIYFEKNTADMQRGIFVKDLASGVERSLFTIRVFTHADVAIVGEGEKIWYREALDGTPKSGDWAIRELDVATGNVRELGRGPITAMLASTDRSAIAVLVRDQASSSTIVRVIQAGAGEPRDLMRVPDLQPAAGRSGAGRPAAQFLRWAPDNRSILVKKRTDADGPVETWWVPLDGRPAARIDDGAGGEMASMVLHPDGRQVAFTLTKQVAARPQQLWVLENILPASKAGSK